MSEMSYFVLGTVTGITIGFVICFLIYLSDLKSERLYRDKRVREMRARIKPFSDLAIEYMKDDDREGFEKVQLDIYRIMWEYVELY
jgi:hypothetical protein